MKIVQGQTLYIVKNMGVRVVEVGDCLVTKVGSKLIHVEISRYKTIKLSINNLTEKTDYGCWHTGYYSQDDYKNIIESSQLQDKLVKRFNDLKGKLSAEQARKILEILN